MCCFWWVREAAAGHTGQFSWRAGPSGTVLAQHGSAPSTTGGPARGPWVNTGMVRARLAGLSFGPPPDPQAQVMWGLLPCTHALYILYSEEKCLVALPEWPIGCMHSSAHDEHRAAAVLAKQGLSSMRALFEVPKRLDMPVAA